MFINQLSIEDKSVLTQELILSGINKNALSKIKPLEEVLKEEIPYNTEASTPLEIGNTEGTAGIIPQILKLLNTHNREFNTNVSKYHLGVVNTTSIILENKSFYLTDEFIYNLDKVLLIKNTGSFEYRRLALKMVQPLIQNILQVVEAKINIVIDIQDKCLGMIQDSELVLEYFQKSNKYPTVTLEDITPETFIPSAIFFNMVQGEFPELIEYMYEGEWGDSLIDFDSTLDNNDLVNRTKIIQFCKDRIKYLSDNSLSTVPHVFNEIIVFYTKALSNHYETNNLLPSQTFTSRFYNNKTSFGNRIINVFNKIIKSSIKRYLISRINNNPILLGTFLLENQLTIYNDYGFNKTSTSGVMGVVRKVSDNTSGVIQVLNKPEVQAKHYKQYREDLLPYFNHHKLTDVLRTISGDDYSSLLVASASSFKARNDLFFWLGISETVIKGKMADFSNDNHAKTKGKAAALVKKNKDNPTDFFAEILRLRFKVVLHNLFESTKLEHLIGTKFLKSSSNSSTMEDLIVTIDYILIIPEILGNIKSANPYDTSLASFYKIFQNFLKEINQEFPLLSLIEEVQDIIFVEEENTLSPVNYVPNKGKKTSYLYNFNKQNTFMTVIQLSELHRLISTALSEDNPELGLSIIDNIWEVQNSYQSNNYGTQDRNSFHSGSSQNEFFNKLFQSLNRDVSKFLDFSNYLGDYQQAMLNRFFDNLGTELDESTVSQEEISLVQYQLLSIKVIDKVNLINTTNNILAKTLLKKCSNIELLLKEQGGIVQYLNDIKDRSASNASRLIEDLVNPMLKLNITVPTFDIYQESTTGTITKIVNYSTSTQLPLLFIISNMLGTDLFKEAQEVGSLRKSCTKLLNDSWVELQTHAPLINNILAVLAEGTYYSKYNNDRQLAKVFWEYQVETESTRLPRDGFIDFQDHLINDPERGRYYVDRRDKMRFFVDISYYRAGTAETFYTEDIRLDWESIKDINGDSILGEKICPVFRDYFMYNDFRYIIAGVSNNIGLELNDVDGMDGMDKKENIISRIYSTTLVPVHEFKFNILIGDNYTVSNDYFDRKKSYNYDASKHDKFKNITKEAIQQYRNNIVLLIQEAYQLFHNHPNYYYKHLGSTLNLLIDNNSILYSHNEIHKWITSSWKDLPLLWNLPDYFLKHIRLEELIHVLNWSTAKPELLGMFFSKYDFEKLLSKKFKFKGLLFQEIINLFYNCSINPAMDNLLEILPMDFNPSYSREQARFVDLATAESDNVVTEERVMKVLYDPKTGIIPNLDNPEGLHAGFSHYLKYYEALLNRYMLAQDIDEDELPGLKNQITSMFSELIKGGNVGLPAGITLNCFRNELPASKLTFINLFIEPQLTNLIPVELLTDVVDEDDEEEEDGV